MPNTCKSNEVHCCELSGERVSNTSGTCPEDEDNHRKLWLILDRIIKRLLNDLKTLMASLQEGLASH